MRLLWSATRHAETVVALGLMMLGSGHFASSPHEARARLYCSLADALCAFDPESSSGGTNAAYTSRSFPLLLTVMKDSGVQPQRPLPLLALPAQLNKSLASFCTSSTQLLQNGKSGAGGQARQAHNCCRMASQAPVGRLQQHHLPFCRHW